MAWFKRKSQDSTGPRVSVAVERNGALVRFDDVPVEDTATVLAEILRALRSLTREFPELVPDLSPVPGGYPIDASDSDDWAEEGRRLKRIGFLQTTGRTRDATE